MLIKYKIFKRGISFAGLLLWFIVVTHAAAAFAGTATLTWDAPTTNTDGSSLALTNIAKYKLYYGLSSQTYTQSIDIVNTGINPISYTLNNVSPGTYYFAVTAMNASGQESGYSNQASKSIQPAQYTLTTTKTGAGTGTISSTPAGITCGTACAGTYNEGTSVTLTEVPGINSLFSGWSGACTGTGVCTVTIAAAKTVTATFALNTKYTITPSVGAGGAISPANVVSVNSGSAQTFTITPSTGYHITNVLVDGVSKGAVTTYNFSNVAANHTIAASFAINTYTVTSTGGTGGTLAPLGSVVVNYGSNKTVVITPGTGYHIANVLVDGASVGAVATYTFSNVTKNHTISALFAMNTYTITTTAGTGGAISPSSAVSVNSGASQPVTITPSTGYGISKVLVDGVSVGAVKTYTFSNVTANHSIIAIFVSNSSYTITASVSGSGGTIFPSSTLTVPSGGSGIFSITPNAGYHVANVLVDNKSVGPVTSYTFTNAAANHGIVASFAINTYTVFATSTTGGAISPSGPTSVNYGGKATLSVTAYTGKKITDVQVDGMSVGAVSAYTFSNITANHTLSATFGAVTNITCSDPGIPCVERVDGQPDGNNLVNNIPKVDVEFEFRTTVIDKGGTPQYVRLAMSQRNQPAPGDFYRYDMNCSGDFGAGALCTYRTQLGPAAKHKFYIEVMFSDSSIVTYPQAGSLDGPQIQLLNGYNLIGAPRNLTGASLTGVQAFGTDPTYRSLSGRLTWITNSKYFDLVDTSASPVKPGEGYFGNRTNDSTLLDLDTYSDLSNATVTISLKSGWNVISNPYGGNVKLSDLLVKKGTALSVPWLQAAASGWLTNALYYYTGSDWGETYLFESAGGTPDALLVPWRAYYIYLRSVDTAYSLIVPKP